jgi:glycosyltransferase involved in cell wall biosynthesis
MTRTRRASEREPVGVLYVANSAKIGGGNRVLMDIASGLNRDRFIPHIVTPGPGPLAEWAAGAGIDVRSTAAGDWSGRGGLVRRAAMLALMARRKRVGVLHAMAPMCYRALGLAGRVLGLPRVCHLGFPPAPGELAWSFQSAPDAVVACYEGQARAVVADVRALSPDCRVVAIPNGIDTRVYRPAPVNWETHRQLRGDASHVVLITGHLSDVKGYPTFIRAAARIARELPDCRFLALGGETTGPGPLARFEALAGELGIADRVRFLGFRSDVADVLRAADIVVLPSLDEGLPLAVLEAMACAKPVVATPVGGVPEAVVDESTGILIPPSDPESLASAVLRVLNDRDLARQMGNAGMRRAQEHFSVRRLVAEVEALYEQAMAGPVVQRRSMLAHAVAPTVRQS